jgi:drug/metabolite transporter (DMT)-like permease
MSVSFIGVVLIAVQKPSGEEQGKEKLGMAVAFTLAWVYAFVNVINRKLKQVSFSVIGFYHAVCGLTVALAYFCISGKMPFLEIQSTGLALYLFLGWLSDFVTLNS